MNKRQRIRELLGKGVSYRAIKERLAVSHSTIAEVSQIMQRESYNSVTRASCSEAR